MKSQSLIISILILLLTVCVSLAADLTQPRTWTSGNYTIEGKFLELTDNGTTVRIEKTDGKHVKIALEKLSPEDQKFVKGITSRSEDDDQISEDENDPRSESLIQAKNQYALLIGVNEYMKPINSLRYCVNDMKLLADTFVKIGVPQENIFLMTDDSPEPKLRPTGANIRNQIENVTKLMGSEDQLLIAFSGHGAMVGDEAYFCPSDTYPSNIDSLIPRDWAFNQLEKCQAKNKIFIIDTRGQILPDQEKWNVRAEEQDEPTSKGQGLVDPPAGDSCGFLLISSCDRNQQSWEDSKLGHGVFMYFFAEGLAGAAKDEEGYVSALHIFMYAGTKTEKYVHNRLNVLQIPTIRMGQEMTDFYIAKLESDPEDKSGTGNIAYAPNFRDDEDKSDTENKEYAPNFRDDDEDRRSEPEKSRNQHVLLIGVNDYSNPIPKLKYCAEDMELLADSFKKIGISEQNIILVTDKSPELRPTGANIRNQIQKVTQDMKPQDQLTIVFSGYGVRVDQKAYFCPSDADPDDLNSLIPRDWAFDQLEKCKAKQKVFILDACRGDLSLGRLKPLEDPIGPDMYGFIRISSCDKEQWSLENSELKHGVFMYFLSEGLSEKFIGSVQSLFLYAYFQTTKYVHNKFKTMQVPTFYAGVKTTDSHLGKWIDLSNSTLLKEGKIAGEQKVLEIDGIPYSFRWCPWGKFMMGSLASAASSNGQPRHNVALNLGFWMLETKVTQAMWQSVMGRSQADQNKLAGALSSCGMGPQYPVYRVNWNECQAFCQRLGEWLNYKVQLPTEAQWEYACRARTTTEFAGNGELEPMAWYNKNSGSSTHEVRKRKPNQWGLYDMHGNVSEWCSDWYSPDYYSESPEVDPENKTESSSRVVRGGSWGSGDTFCRSDQRSNAAPDTRNPNLGFRFILVPLPNN